MTKRTRTLLVLPLAAAALLMAACGSTTADPAGASVASMASTSTETTAPESMEAESMDAMASESMAPTESAEAAAPDSGAYISLAEYEGSKDMYDAGEVVLFFAADWCPTCQEATENLEADPTAIPAGLAIVRVDYDDSDELKKKYGVTVQHTFVQVDADGNEIAKWSGSVTADQIAKQTA